MFRAALENCVANEAFVRQNNKREEKNNIPSTCSLKPLKLMVGSFRGAASAPVAASPLGASPAAASDSPSTAFR
eukprot:2034230-Prymnesium_polylepis.1